MANFYATARSNYFTVKDLNAFREALEPVSIEIRERENGTVMIHPYSCSDYGGWPGPDYYDEQRDEDVPFDVIDVIQEHITDNECAVLIQVGNEKLRYIEGIAWAITSNDVETISLDDIYELASKMVTSDVTRAEY